MMTRLAPELSVGFEEIDTPEPSAFFIAKYAAPYSPRSAAGFAEVGARAASKMTRTVDALSWK